MYSPVPVTASILSGRCYNLSRDWAETERVWETGDWGNPVSVHSAEYETNWILSPGLGPEALEILTKMIILAKDTSNTHFYLCSRLINIKKDLVIISMK